MSVEALVKRARVGATPSRQLPCMIKAL